jgi:hypothetical protein
LTLAAKIILTSLAHHNMMSNPWSKFFL